MRQHRMDLDKSTVSEPNESKRRSIVKSIVWRFIGIIWTWVGAYVIMLLIPPSRNTAVLIATLIVIYHHSTRMIMYYFYERLWASVSWGRTETAKTMSGLEKSLWIASTFASIVIIFFLIIYVTPLIKGG